MGVLTSLGDASIVYLKPAHVFGRDPNIADYILHSETCSRMHFVIRWQNGAWFLLDESRNGCFINGVKVTKGQPIRLNKKDTVSAIGKDEPQWLVTCDKRPKPSLITLSRDAYIELDTLNLLPDKKNPECQIMQKGQRWFFEKGHDFHPISEGSQVVISDERWAFYPNNLVEETVYHSNKVEETATLIFNVNRSEEHIQLFLENERSHFDLGIKTHHYLLLEMARHAVDDPTTDLNEKGWMSNELLLNNLGIDINNLNIQIYRARKALSKYSYYWSQNLIERRRGEIRLHPCYIEINKADS